MNNIHNACLRVSSDPLVHYARRPQEALMSDDAGGTICNILYYVGKPAICGHARLAAACVVDEPVTCVICAIGYMVWP